MNRRRATNVFSVDDIKALEAAEGHARRISCRLNCLLTFAPFRDCNDVPTPEARTEAWERLHSHLSMWAKRRGFAFTAIWAWHADEDGSNPHVHVFAHLPTSRRRDDLQAALVNVYPDPGVIDVRAADDFLRRHSDEGYGSMLGYLTRFRSQQAYMRSRWKGASLPRACRRDETGAYRGIKAPIIGKRFGITRNINARAQENYRRALTHARIAAERRMIATRPRRPVSEEAPAHQEAAQSHNIGPHKSVQIYPCIPCLNDGAGAA